MEDEDAAPLAFRTEGRIGHVTQNLNFCIHTCTSLRLGRKRFHAKMRFLVDIFYSRFFAFETNLNVESETAAAAALRISFHVSVYICDYAPDESDQT